MSLERKWLDFFKLHEDVSPLILFRQRPKCFKQGRQSSRVKCSLTWHLSISFFCTHYQNNAKTEKRQKMQLLKVDVHMWPLFSYCFSISHEEGEKHEVRQRNVQAHPCRNNVDNLTEQWLKWQLTVWKRLWKETGRVWKDHQTNFSFLLCLTSTKCQESCFR